MPSYQSPGVYVEEIPSAVQAIAGVGTSTAGFIGIVNDPVEVPVRITERITPGNQTQTTFDLEKTPVVDDPRCFEVWVGGERVKGVTPVNPNNGAGKSAFTLEKAPGAKSVVVNYLHREAFTDPDRAQEAVPKLCTSFGDFKKFFGDFSLDEGQRTLSHAVYGFFNNGGTRCFVVRISGTEQLDAALDALDAVDEVALVAAPGLAHDKTVVAMIDIHCRSKTQDRFAILDSREDVGSSLDKDSIDPPPNSDYAAFYFPWIKVFDPVTKMKDPDGDGGIYAPPSGHIAGIYARVDTNRGVHKAPANEPVFGALGLRYPISKAQQDGLNPQGINCIRDLNGNIRVWGARTIGGDANGEFRYVNVRRSMLFLRESIDEGLQWAVFEPNDLNLWAKITRNVSAFLTTQWRAGMLFGATPQEAFYVKCDAETNPPELREVGQVVTEIGVAIVKPAEFVIFRISQWQPQKGG
jgi:phage tail sheath protein FI